MNTKIPKKVQFYGKNYSKVMIRFIPQYRLWNQYSILLQALQPNRLSWLCHFLRASYTTFQKKFFAILLTIQKWQAVQYLLIFNTFLLQHPMKCIRFTFEILFKNTTITTNFLKSHIFNTCSIELRTLFAIFNKKN